MPLQADTTPPKWEGDTKKPAEDNIESPMKRLRTIIDELEAERDAWHKEKAEMQSKLDAALNDNAKLKEVAKWKEFSREGCLDTNTVLQDMSAKIWELKSKLRIIGEIAKIEV
ncbi:hypothetical protein P154DRAFT_571512 [Amniculicola lignicola CBS 123094]|uniref:Uncharacterized protein n=1 Tax=Amniculicola lignicola CBS 123094 TaxID=1392246 RepID=A0A6A5X1A0_9PLEO|nr:hypothetical protein P154DRAFT_571512 [Amniculicola lignicola CBS 123094]